ncbi:hypothetical protein R1sor_021675 [Riccia sorocarpa]|uniref:Uncharacterized protein n=1 Tax=Riccia sorocarpa TaxID=122646 RepID=A0ABD3GJW5_9MARC
MIVQLVEGCPQLMLEHSARLEECLDYLTFLSSASASSLVRAICPLFQLSRDLQYYTILVLRKAMFGREESARMTAVQGLLELVIAEKKPVINANLLQDLLGLLRRCLSQQANVREMLYQGLPKLLQMDPDSAENIFDLLFPHFSRYYSSGPLITLKKRKTEHPTAAEDERVEQHNIAGEQEGSADEDEGEDSQAAPSSEVLEIMMKTDRKKLKYQSRVTKEYLDQGRRMLVIRLPGSLRTQMNLNKNRRFGVKRH